MLKELFNIDLPANIIMALETRISAPATSITLSPVPEGADKAEVEALKNQVTRLEQKLNAQSIRPPSPTLLPSSPAKRAGCVLL